jgi:hypothetical protein
MQYCWTHPVPVLCKIAQSFIPSEANFHKKFDIDDTKCKVAFYKSP